MIVLILLQKSVWYNETMIYNLYTNGSHSYDLNIAGMGGILFDSEKKKVLTFSEPITTLMASHEMHAMEHGLKNLCKQESNISFATLKALKMPIVYKKENSKKSMERAWFYLIKLS